MAVSLLGKWVTPAHSDGYHSNTTMEAVDVTGNQQVSSSLDVEILAPREICLGEL